MSALSALRNCILESGGKKDSRGRARRHRDIHAERIPMPDPTALHAPQHGLGAGRGGRDAVNRRRFYPDPFVRRAEQIEIDAGQAAVEPFLRMPA